MYMYTLNAPRREESLVEPFVLPLGSELSLLAGDRFNAEAGELGEYLPVQCRCVIGEHVLVRI